MVLPEAIEIASMMLKSPPASLRLKQVLLHAPAKRQAASCAVPRPKLCRLIVPRWTIEDALNRRMVVFRKT